MSYLYCQLYGFLRYFIVITFILSVQFLYADDFVFSIKPNPVVVGDEVKLTAISKLPLSSVTFRLKSGKEIILNSVNDLLFNANWLVPTDYKGEYWVEVVFLMKSGKTLVLTDSFQVVSLDSQQRFNNSIDAASVDVLRADNDVALNIQIDELEDNVDVLEQEKNNLKNQISDLEKEINYLKNNPANLEDQEKLIQKRALLDQLDLKLRKKQERMSIQLSLLSEKLESLNQSQQELAKKEKLLSDVERNLNERQRQLMQEYDSVEQQKLLAIQQQENLKGLTSEFSLKQDQLNAQLVKVNNKNKVLVKKDKVLKKREEKLNEVRQNIKVQSTLLTDQKRYLNKLKKDIYKDKSEFELEKKALSTQKAEVVFLQENLAQEKQQVNQLKLNFNQQSELLALEQQKLKDRNESVSRSFKKQNEILDQKQSELLLSRQKIDEMEANYRLKNEKFESNFIKFKLKEEELNDKMTSFELVVDNVVQLEKDLLLKYESLEQLESYTKDQLILLRKESNESVQGRNLYLDQLDFRVKNLDKMGELMEKRVYQMYELNKSLKQKNRDFEQKLNRLLSYDSHYSFSSFLRLNSFNSSNHVSHEFGAAFATFIMPRIFLRGGASFESQVVRTNTSLSKNQNGMNVFVTSHFIFNPGYPVQINGFLGAVDGLGLDQQFSFLWGGQLRFLLNNRLHIYFDGAYSDQWGITFGVGKLFSFPYRLPSVKSGSQQSSSLPVNMVLNVPSNHFLFQKNKILFNDISSHWAEQNIIDVVQLGILEGKTSFEFAVESVLTHLEMAKSLVYTFYSDQMVLDSKIKIKYSIIASPTEECFVTLDVVNKSGDVVRTLLTDESRYRGDYVLEWDGTDQAGKKLEFGDYYVQLSVSKLDLVEDNSGSFVFKKAGVDTIKNKIVFTFFQTPNVDLDGRSLTFLDLKNVDQDINHVVNKSYQLNFFKLPQDFELLSKGYYFYPDQPVTRLQFILAVSRLLVQLGANNSMARVDFSPYKDVEMLDSQTRRYLSIYAMELGYGGTTDSKLNPDQYITKAEAATIINRFLKWRYSG